MPAALLCFDNTIYGYMFESAVKIEDQSGIRIVYIEC